MKKPVAICQNKKIFDHSTSWVDAFVQSCEKIGLPYEIVDCYGPEIISELNNYSALLWQYQNYVPADILEARNIIKAAEQMGLETFPSSVHGWHFDDKIAQMYALQSVQAPIPQSWVFYREKDCIEWLKTKAQYPLVAKLRCGSGSNNVKLLRGFSDAKRYAHRMFAAGYNPAPSLAYKAYSKVQSTRNLDVFVKRVKRIPEFLRTRKGAKKLPIEKGYCYFQEYVQNEGFDLKVVVINDKMTFCARDVRKHDFRASGSGSCYYDRSLLTDNVIDTAFDTAKKLGFQCMGFDFVVDSATGEGKIVEMCYGFDYLVQAELGAYVDRNHVWHEETVIVPEEIVSMISREVTSNENRTDR